MGEFAFIAALRRDLAAKLAANRRLRVPPGDDCAAVAADGPYLFAADMLLEGVHFDLRTATPALVGRKALAVNLSDIAAMAGTPTSVTVSLALPRRGGRAVGDELMAGIMALAAEYDVAVAGGDTNSWDGPLVVAVAITGTEHARGNVTRAGAKIGDVVCVTGALGGSLASGRHLHFTPRLAAARMLHDRYGLNAMIDLSDGLSADLGHILAASDVGATLVKASIPIHVDAQPSRPGVDRTPLTAALNDGEDFELCFTLPAAAAAALATDWPLAATVPITQIGTIVAASPTQSSRLHWSDGTPLPGGGYSHTLA